MLRDIPEDVDKEEIKTLFGEYSSFIVDMRPEIGDNYLVDFNSADVTQNAHIHVRQQSFRGKPVSGFIKTNYNYYSPPQMFYPPQESTYIPNEYENENYTRRPYRGRGRGGRRFPNGRNRGFANDRQNAKPRIEYQDLVSESFPPLKSNTNVRREQADKKYSVDQIVDIVSNLEDIISPEYVNENLSALSDTPNIQLEIGKFYPNSKVEWISKKRKKEKNPDLLVLNNNRRTKKLKNRILI